MSAPEATRAALADALSADTPRRVCLEIPPGSLPWRAAWAAAGEGEALLWRPPEGRRAWGLGVAARVSPAEGGAGLRRALERYEPAGEIGQEPPFFAALPFDAAAPAPEPWAPFAPGLLVLPRLGVVEEGERAWLWVIAERPRAEREELLGLLDRLGAPAPEPTVGEGAAPAPLERDREGWERAIRAALAEIAAGRLRKLVVARAARYRLPAAPAVEQALSRLIARQPRCAVFAFRQGGSTFLGATPERLVQRAGRRVRTDALAGTGADPAALLQSPKDRLEHQIVVDAIAGALAPRCARLDWPETPDVLSLPTLCHLRTRFEGELRDDDHALALAALLHPTPAVGGDPREAALAVIRAEPAPRGLYAGPVGLVDAGGDGDLWVALRSGVLAGQELCLFAGVGVVAGSDPAAEWAETERKLSAMEAVFGP